MERNLGTVLILFLIFGTCIFFGGISAFHDHLSSISLVDGSNGLTESSLEHLEGIEEEEDKSVTRDKVNDILHGLMVKYDNRVRPFYPKDKVLVTVDLEDVRIDDVLEQGSRELAITFLIRQTWSDPRLVFVESGYDELDEIDRVTLANDHIRELWLPDTCIPNEKMSSESGESTVDQDFVAIYKNGTVTRSSLMMISTYCAFEYGGFPFESQLCSVELSSHAYSFSEVSYIWDSGFILRVNNFPESGLLSDDDKYVSGFVITDVEVNETVVDQKSRLVFYVTLQRMWRVYIGRYYLPMVLFVFGSVVSLFFEKGKRGVALGVLNLALVNLFVAVRSSAPDIPTTSEFTSYDRYFMICLAYMCVVLAVSVYRSLFGDEVNCRNYSTQETMVLRRQSGTSSRRESADVFSTMASDGGDRYDEIEEAVGRDSDAIYRSTSYVIGGGGQSRGWVRLRRVGRKVVGWVSKYLNWILVASFLLTDYVYFKVHSVKY